MIYDAYFGAQPWVNAELLGADYSVVIVGAGAAGIFLYHSLMLSGIRDVIVIDKNPESKIGSWTDHAYNEYLRSPKAIDGWERGISDLSIKTYITGKYGKCYWSSVNHITRNDWIDYIAWFRDRIGLSPIYSTECYDIALFKGRILLAIKKGSNKTRITCRAVVLATGMAGYGGLYTPDGLNSGVPKSLVVHANSPSLGGMSFKNKRIAILGVGASAFDAGNIAITSGAAAVDICYRRKTIPDKEFYRRMESYFFLEQYKLLRDYNKIRIADFLYDKGTPPAAHHYEKLSHDRKVSFRPGIRVQDIRLDGRGIIIRSVKYDLLICATGFNINCQDESMLRSLCKEILHWGDIYAPVDYKHKPSWARFPYLGDHYELLLKSGIKSGIFMFNIAANMSFGYVGAVSVSSYKFGIPRLVRGVVRLLANQIETSLVDDFIGIMER